MVTGRFCNTLTPRRAPGPHLPPLTDAMPGSGLPGARTGSMIVNSSCQIGGWSAQLVPDHSALPSPPCPTYPMRPVRPPRNPDPPRRPQQ